MIVILLAMLWQAPGVPNAGPSGAPESAAAQALRQRAQQFYSLLQLRQMKQVEGFVAKDSRERLSSQPGTPILGFRILSVAVNPDGQTASLVAELTMMAQTLGQPVPVPRTTHWRLEDQEWRIEIPEPPAAGSVGSMMGAQPAQATKPEELKFQGHSYSLGVMKPGEHKEARFPFTNTSDHTVSILQIATGCDCLQVKTQQMRYKSGESGELVVEFDSTDYEFEYVQTVVLKTDPGEITSYLQIHAQVVPRDIAFPPNRPESSPKK